MSEPLLPLESDLRELLDDERDAPGPTTASADRVFAGVRGAVATVGSQTDEGHGGRPGQGISAAARVLRVLARKSVSIAAASFVAGGLVGAAAQRSRMPAAVASSPAAAGSWPGVSPQPSSPAIVAAPSGGPDISLSPIPVAALPSASASPVAEIRESAAEDGKLGAERALLDAAHVALLRREHGAALDALSRHEQRFPHGQLIDERESMRIQALASAGRAEEARARGARFHEAYPRSLFLPSVDAALRSIP